MFPCARLRISAGNLKKVPLSKIWYNAKIFKILRNRNNLKGKCKDCIYQEICGGCRAQALASTGDYLEEDPLCFI